MDLLKIPLVNQILVVVGVMSTILSCGLGLGFMASFVDHQKTDVENSINDTTLHYIETYGEVAFVISIVLIPVTMQKKGRRIASLTTALPLLLSWIISLTNNNAVILVNILQNFSLGGAVSSSSVIISEFCSPKCRAAILMLETAMISLGVLISHVFALYSSWNSIFALGVLSSACGLAATYFWLESPYWLVNEGHIMKCTENFYMIRGFSDEACKELDALLMVHKVKFQLRALRPIMKIGVREQGTDFLKSLLKTDFLKPLSIMILLFSFVGFGGENVASSFSYRDVFKLTYGKYIGTIILDVSTVVCSFIACVLIQIVKRRTLFIFTSSVSLLFLGATGLLFFLQSLGMFSQEYIWLLLSFSTGFAMFMSLGSTALPFSLLGEIFPMSYKGVGCSLTCAYLWAFSNSVLSSVPYLTRSLGLPALVLLSLVFMTVVLMILCKIMPETSSKTLLEIEQIMSGTRDEDYDAVNTNDDETGDRFDKASLFLTV